MRTPLLGILLLLCFTLIAVPARAQSDEELQRASILISQNKFGEAAPLLCKLTAAHPQEGPLWTRLGLSLHMLAASLTDPGERKKLRVEAREALLKAKQLGVKDTLVEEALAVIPVDGSEGDAPFRQNPEANQHMVKAQRAFAQGAFAEAEIGYQQAFALEPKLYEAPLWAGDSCLRAGQLDRAEEWFAKAVAVAPEREMAYRYWGNTLLQQGKHDQARANLNWTPWISLPF